MSNVTKTNLSLACSLLAAVVWLKSDTPVRAFEDVPSGDSRPSQTRDIRASESWQKTMNGLN